MSITKQFFLLAFHVYLKLQMIYAKYSFSVRLVRPKKRSINLEDEEKIDTTPFILGTGRSEGTFRYKQAFLAQKLIERHPHLDDQEHAKIRDIFIKTGIEECSSCCPENLLFKNIGKAAWVEHIKASHLKMGGEAMEKALEAWGGDRKHITHFLWVTATTSQLMPPEGLVLGQKHGLLNSIMLVPILNVGCCGGFRALALAKDIVNANPTKHIVLIVSAEARSSLGNAMPFPETATEKVQRNALVQAALFRDGASAAVVGSIIHKSHHQGMTSPLPSLSIVDATVTMTPYKKDHGVNTQEFDNNFICVSTIRELPLAVGQLAAEQVGFLLGKHRINPQEYLFFVHTPSKSALQSMTLALGLEPETYSISQDCVRSHGNIGGASNLFVVDRWLREQPDVVRKYKYALCMAPSAGITGQCVLLRIGEGN